MCVLGMLTYMYSIYVHTTPDGRKYVGCTSQKNLNRRWKNGSGYKSSHNKVFFEAIKFFGWDNIQHEVVETTENKRVALQLEEYYTILWRTNEPEFGYNVKVCNTFTSLSEETKRKMSEAHKCKPRSEETRKKLSESHKGKHWKLVDGKRVWY